MPKPKSTPAKAESNGKPVAPGGALAARLDEAGRSSLVALRLPLALPPMKRDEEERCYGHAVRFRDERGRDLWAPSERAALGEACGSYRYSEHVRGLSATRQNLNPAMYPEAFEAGRRGRPSSSAWAHFADVLSQNFADARSELTPTLRLVVFAAGALGVGRRGRDADLLGVVNPADDDCVRFAVENVRQLLLRLHRTSTRRA